MIVELPLPRNMANTNRNQHWAVKEKAKKRYWKTCSTLLQIGQLPKPPETAPAKAVISCHIVAGGRMDQDNLYARLKWPIDWLVGNGYIAGDSPAHVVWGENPTQTVRRGVPYLATFTISAVDA